MAAAELCDLGIAELGRRYRARELSPVDVATAHLARIERLDKTLNSYVTVTRGARARRRARGRGRHPRGTAGPLAGIPIAYKDLYATRGVLHHRRLGAARRLGARPRLDVRDAAPAGRHGDAGQAHHPRVRLRHPVPRSPVPAGAQSVEPRSHSRRLLERLGRRAGGRAHRGRARLGHRRIDPRPGGVLRHRRAQADLRSREPGRRPDALVDARSHRPDGALRRGLRPHAPGAGRLRRRRSRVEPRARAGLHRGARGRRPRAARRRAARLLLPRRQAGGGGRLRVGHGDAAAARRRRPRRDHPEHLGGARASW